MSIFIIVHLIKPSNFKKRDHRILDKYQLGKDNKFCLLILFIYWQEMGRDTLAGLLQDTSLKYVHSICNSSRTSIRLLLASLNNKLPKFTQGSKLQKLFYWPDYLMAYLIIKWTCFYDAYILLFKRLKIINKIGTQFASSKLFWTNIIFSRPWENIF